MYRVLRPAHHKRVPVPKKSGSPFNQFLTFPLSSPSYYTQATYLTRRVDFRGVPFRFVLQVDFEAFVWKFRFFECKLSLRTRCYKQLESNGVINANVPYEPMGRPTRTSEMNNRHIIINKIQSIHLGNV